MKTKRAEDIKLGDVIVFLGQPHLVSCLDGVCGWGWPVARSSDGWSYTLEPGSMVEVAG